MANITGQANSDTAQTASAGGSGKNRTVLYIAIAIVVIAIVVLLFSTGLGSGLVATTTVLPTTNSQPLYMSVSNAETLLNSPIINVSYNYSATSLYNYTSQLNISLMESFVPEFAGNATNGWVTAAFGSGLNNASIFYFVVQTENASNMSALLAQAIASTFPTLPNISNGATNGMNYTYETYSNSTDGAFQILIGYKDGYVSMAYLQANNFTTNQTQMADISAGNIP